MSQKLAMNRYWQLDPKKVWWGIMIEKYLVYCQESILQSPRSAHNQTNYLPVRTIVFVVRKAPYGAIVTGNSTSFLQEMVYEAPHVKRWTDRHAP